MERFSKEFDRPIDHISPAAMAVLESHDWPGNVRELEHAMERAILLADGTSIELADIPGSGESTAVWKDIPDDAAALAELKQELRASAVERVERLFVLKALRTAGWNVSQAARDVGMARPNLHALMRKHDITAPRNHTDEEEAPEGEGEDS